MIDQRDRKILRDLAKKVAEFAADPVMNVRREMWKKHNRLERVRPMILVFPEGSWRELVPQSSLQCEGEKARTMELELRKRIFKAEHIYDDSVVEKRWAVDKSISHTGWGLQPRYSSKTKDTGSWGFDPVINEPGDLKKLKFPEVIYNEKESQENLAEAQELFGDLLDVYPRGIIYAFFHLMNLYCKLRGLEQVMYDMYDEPEMLHEAMSFLEEGTQRLIDQYYDMNLLSLNNDETNHSSGGVGYSTELPLPDYDPGKIRTCDMWGAAEAQEMAQVSPEMHNEFILQYEKRILKRFGLNGYGCCEDLTNKLDYIFTIPNLRRISISPWANVDKCAPKLKGDYIFSWKPHPGYLVGDFNPDAIREYVKHTLDVTRDCVIELVLKDTHTCENRPERFTIWTRIVQELVKDY